MTYQGRLKKFMEGKGFGFIECFDGSEDVFLHFSKLTNGGVNDMIVGMEVCFDLEEDPRSGKMRATNCTITSPGIGGGGGGYGNGGGGGFGKGGGGGSYGKD